MNISDRISLILCQILPAFVVRRFTYLSLAEHRVLLKRISIYRRTTDRALRHLLRLNYEGAQSEGYDHWVDEVIHVAKLKIIFPSDFTNETTDDDSVLRFREFYRANSDHINSFIQRVLDSPDVRHLVVEYYRTAKYWDNHFNYTRGIDPTAKEFSNKQLALLIPEMRGLEKKYQRQIQEKEALKFDIDVANLPRLISLFTVFVFVSGMIYTSAYMYQFGIDVTNYYELNDYIPSTIRTMTVAIVTSAVSVVASYMGMIKTSRQSFAAHSIYKSEARKSIFPLFKLLQYMVAASIGLAIWKGQTLIAFSQTFFLWVLIVTQNSESWTRYLFKDARKMGPVVVFFCLFSGYMAVTMARNIYEIKHGTTKKQISIKFENETDAHLIPDTTRLIGATSRYYFFWNPMRKSSVVIDRSKVRAFTFTDQIKELTFWEIKSLPP